MGEPERKGDERDRADGEREDSLAEPTRAELAALLRAMPVPLIAYAGPEHRVTLINDAFRALGGTPALLGRPLAEGLPSAAAQGVIALLDRVLSGGAPYQANEFEYTVTRPDGSRERRWYTTSFQPVQGPNGESTGVVAAGLDVTETVLARRELERAHRLKDEFLARVSHELATPLFALRTWVELLRTDAAPRERALEAISHCVEAQSKLIGDLLDATRAASGKLRLAVEEVSLKPLVERAVDAARALAAERGLSLELGALDADAAVMGDPSRLGQVLDNLLGNALKFTPPGGRVRVEVGRSGERCTISVRDTGRGFLPEQGVLLFTPFWQAPARPGSGEGGLGLGLTIAEQLVALHGGTLAAESPGPGQGSTFTVSLPGADFGFSAEGEGRSSPAAELAGLRVLLVDDDALTREAVGLLLRARGAEISSCATVEEALAELSRNRPAVVITDLSLAGEDGFSLLRRVRERAPELPVVALTAHAREEDKRRAALAGFSLHLGKPVDPAALLAAVARLARG